eukprot:jgi/Mesvir1/25993/Mv20962-RA.1
MSSTGNEKLTPPVVHDGMPRYPNISPPGALRAMDLFGTGVFALSGTLTAGIAGMDLLGCTIVGTITAVGGGTIRDILLGKGPAFWMDEIEYLYICLATALATFYFWDDITAATGITEDGLGLFIADTIGVGAFAVIGAQNGIRAKVPLLASAICGMMTATFGGLTRDVLCRRPVRILHSNAEIYATTALGGALAYLAAAKAGAPLTARIALGFSTAVALRCAAWTYGIRLPNFPQVPAASAPAASQAPAEQPPKK